MEIPNKNTPAFPVVINDNTEEHYQGLMMRDYFAAKAMAAIIGRDGPGGDDTAIEAYQCADRMMRVRDE